MLYHFITVNDKIMYFSANGWELLEDSFKFERKETSYKYQSYRILKMCASTTTFTSITSAKTRLTRPKFYEKR